MVDSPVAGRDVVIDGEKAERRGVNTFQANDTQGGKGRRVSQAVKRKSWRGGVKGFRKRINPACSISYFITELVRDGKAVFANPVQVRGRGVEGSAVLS